MGLSGPRKRQKISHDPNNTTWSRNTTTFGQRILASQGWAPGQTLGPKNAAHAKHFSNASTSHVRITLREDNLGLGAKLGSGQGPGECTGLHSFQDLLGRLNGKTDAVIEKERRGRADLNRILYSERKYGGWSRFVSAGYLIGGESMEDQLDTTSRAKDSSSTTTTKDMICTTATVVTPEADRKLKKKEKKLQRKDSREEESVPIATVGTDALSEESIARAERKEEKAKRRAEKMLRKERRRKHREEQAEKKAEEKFPSHALETVPSRTPISIPISRTTTTSGSATPVFIGGRHAVRAKYIMQKKQAVMDTKALNEILMVKV